ncbi:HNH endonuclease [Legionella massiliensis]|uniref:HNH endonuclease n=1 Tax=Legionella massiliensis TaxID=1034943 RepID=A0A078KQJ4_9GAMM|nr:HNH endonuclease signature motif containing protein [Legionella massiliensis]CDZ76675.1 HNH endonuclease [Legionella massiliensis]CEE12413.1 HNH endonuclease [Legionella massiliensis]
MIEEKYHDFKYGAVFKFAHDIQEQIINQNLDCIIDLASDLEKQITKPQKNTILHDVIEYHINDYFSVVYFNPYFDVHSIDDIEIFEDNEVINLFEEYQIKYLTIKQYLKKHPGDYFTYGYEYLRGILEDKLSPILKVEVFNLLFDDRNLMKEFNILIAGELDERVTRCKSWPKWLVRALYCREKGLCALCQKDLSHLLHTKNKPAIDHIVPIALKGVNDPTNLQMLCDKCNGNKSDIHITTSNYRPLYW